MNIYEEFNLIQTLRQNDLLEFFIHFRGKNFIQLET